MGCESEIMSSWCVWCPWCMSPVLESCDDFSWYSSSRETNIEMDAQDLPKQNSQELSGRAWCWDRELSMRTPGKHVGNEPHESATRWHPRPLRHGLLVCLSVCLSVVPNLVLNPGLLPGQHTEGWFLGFLPTRCLLDRGFKKRIIPFAFTQTRSEAKQQQDGLGGFWGDGRPHLCTEVTPMLGQVQQGGDERLYPALQWSTVGPCTPLCMEPINNLVLLSRQWAPSGTEEGHPVAARMPPEGSAPHHKGEVWQLQFKCTNTWQVLWLLFFVISHYYSRHNIGIIHWQMSGFLRNPFRISGFQDSNADYIVKQCLSWQTSSHTYSLNL